MKKLLVTGILLTVATMILWSQVPQAMTYKAMAKDEWGVALPNKYITLRFSIIQGSETGPVVYRETQNTTTNKFGLMDVQIGKGTPDIGIFSSIDWSSGVYYIQIEMDPKGGTDFRLDDPAHQLLSVPYALYAESVENDDVDDADNDATNELQTLSVDGLELTIENGNTVFLQDDPDPDPGNEVITNIILNGTILEITEASETKMVDLASLTGSTNIDDLENRVAQLESIVAELSKIDNDEDGFSLADGDCNDNDASVYPGAQEILGDGIDQDCDGSDLVDADNDGDGFKISQGDCNDSDPAIYPYAPEIIGDGIDNNCNGVIDENYFIGQNYGGGIIFYIDETGQHGLVCAPSDQSTFAEWGCSSIMIVGADGTAVGTGYQNTIDIVNGCSTAGIAARICYDLELNGYEDWFLPSKDELNLMYVNLHLNGLGGFASAYYWSSTEPSINFNAYYQAFDYGSQFLSYKTGTYYVRAVRAF